LATAAKLCRHIELKYNMFCGVIKEKNAGKTVKKSVLTDRIAASFASAGLLFENLRVKKKYLFFSF